MKRKIVKISLGSLLSFICKAEEDQYDCNEVYEFVAHSLDYKLDKDEIENYASWYLSKEAEDLDFTKEDYDKCTVKLEEFSKKYCQKPGKKKNEHY